MGFRCGGGCRVRAMALAVAEELFEAGFPVGEVAAVVVLDAGEFGEGTAGVR